MDDKEKIYYLIREYVKGNYSTEVFCDEFTVIYNIEIDYDLLLPKEREYFRDLCSITSRFSADEEELKMLNVYCNETDVRKKISEIIKELNINV